MQILSQLIVNSIIAGSIYTLVAVSFNLIYGVSRFFNLAHGVISTIGGYIVFLLAKELGLNLYFSVMIAIIFAGLIGVILEKLIYLPIRHKRGSGMILLVASLGAFTVLQSIIAIFFGSQFQTLSNSTSTQNIYDIFGGIITQTQLIILVSAILSTLFLMLILKFTTFGKAIKAISDDEEVAKIVGINTNKIVGFVFFIGSCIAGLAGILVGFDTGIEPTMGLHLLLKGVIGAIIGGVGSIPGAFIGSYLLGFIENFGIWKISGEWKDAIAFVVLIVFLIFKPDGIINRNKK